MPVSREFLSVFSFLITIYCYFSMSYRIFLIIFILLMGSQNSVLAQDKRYRVELIVLSHLQHDAIPLESGWLRDFSAAVDFLYVPEPEEDEAADESTENTEAAVETNAAQPGEDGSVASQEELTASAVSDLLPGEADLLPGEAEEVADPMAALVHIETMSEVMQESWRRLRLSRPFRPEQYLSWEQGPDEPFPLLRIHNEEIVLLDDPYADLRAEQAGESDESSPQSEDEEPLVFSDQGSILPGEPAPDEEIELPEPTRFHQIDGTVTLKRSRFLHLELDLEMREAVFDQLAITQALLAHEESEDSDLEMPPPSSFLIHSLKQSRQVKTARMEYFDGPVLSVLAYISAVDPVEDEASESGDSM